MRAGGEVIERGLNTNWQWTLRRGGVALLDLARSCMILACGVNSLVAASHFLAGRAAGGP